MRLALRSFAKSPGFVAAALLTLALGIGATTAMFSILQQIVLRPLPYAEPDQLVQLWEDPKGDGTGRNVASGGVARAWQEQATTLQSLAVSNRTTANLTGSGRPQRLKGLQVNADYLRTLRLIPALGRDFTVEEAKSGQADVTILTHAAWQAYFGGRADVVGSTVRLGDKSRTVVGILPRHARLTQSAEFLLPFDYNTPGWSNRFAGHSLVVVGRLQPGATLAQLRDEMKTITARIRVNFPDFKRNWGVTEIPLQEEVAGPISAQLWLLFGATGCVLFIACANLAGLLLARAISREREMAVRLALGAGRGTIVRQLLAENLLLALVGGTLGLLLALWSISAFESWRPAELASGLAVTLDTRALLFALAVSLVSGLGAGLIPALRLSRTHFDHLKGGNRGSGVGAHTGVRGALIVGQIALSLVLLVGAGLMLRSLMRLQSVSLGFEPTGLLAADISLDPAVARDAARRTVFTDEILRRVSALPGVESAAFTGSLPLQGSLTELVSGEGSAVPQSVAALFYATPEYIVTMRIPVRQGRSFTAADNRPDAPRTMLVNASLAQRYFGAEDPLGRRIKLQDQTYEIVGIVGDVLVRGVEGDRVAQAYLPAYPYGPPDRSLVVRTSLAPLSLSRSVEAAILGFAPEQPVSNFRTFDQIVAQHAFVRRLMLGLLGLFAGVAVALAAIGLYGIIAFSVDRRTRELGIRSALGAPGAALFRLVIASGLRLAALGIALGLVGSWLLSGLLSKFLYETAPTDPLTLATVTLGLLGLAVLACLLPARRAARVDPIVVLRSE